MENIKPMKRSKATTRPHALWVPRTDANGHVHMEMRWVVDQPTRTRSAHAA
ncbi:hypothetical protein [Janibacter sp. G56]|uniref:hypothetical protein n=1 Tax=Janibacter sp. G56 TaxID=3418717 RepID=UPI003D058C26